MWNNRPITEETFIEAQMMDMHDELELMAMDNRGWA